MSQGKVAGRRARAEGRSARQAERSEALGNHCGQPVTGREERRRARRAEALRWRARLWEITNLPRLRNCGRVAHSSRGGAIVRVSETDQGRRAGMAGLQSCGSPWSCPVCARKIGAQRSADVAHVLNAVAAQGGSAALVTLTMRHDRSDLLADLWDALSAAWGAVTSGAAYGKDRETFGIIGWVRTVEVTHGEAGWHVHVHAVVCLDGPTSVEMMQEMGGRMFARWERKLAKLGLSAVADKGGLDVRKVKMDGPSIEAVSDYIAKITYEITSPTTKEGRCNQAGKPGHECTGSCRGATGNRSPFTILRDALETGLLDDLELWWVWEKVSHNRKQVTWSRGLRSWAGLHAREKTDDEIAAEDQHGEAVLILPRATWDQVRTEVADLLDAVELGGVLAGERWLQSRGLTYLRP